MISFEIDSKASCTLNPLFALVSKKDKLFSRAIASPYSFEIALCSAKSHLLAMSIFFTFGAAC